MVLIGVRLWKLGLLIEVKYGAWVVMAVGCELELEISLIALLGKQQHCVETVCFSLKDSNLVLVQVSSPPLGS